MMNDTVRDILAWLWEKHGIALEDLPSGRRGNEDICPIALALRTKYPRAMVSFREYRLDYRGKDELLPACAQRFIAKFEHGLTYQQYILWPAAAAYVSSSYVTASFCAGVGVFIECVGAKT